MPVPVQVTPARRASGRGRVLRFPVEELGAEGVVLVHGCGRVLLVVLVERDEEGVRGRVRRWRGVPSAHVGGGYDPKLRAAFLELFKRRMEKSEACPADESAKQVDCVGRLNFCPELSSDVRIVCAIRQQRGVGQLGGGPAKLSTLRCVRPVKRVQLRGTGGNSLRGIQSGSRRFARPTLSDGLAAARARWTDAAT